MSARQQHGFDFQDYAKKLFHIGDCDEDSYTYEWDGMLNGEPVSIKTEELGTDIEMASFQRNAENTDNFYLIVGFWEGSKDNIVSIETLYIQGDEWHQLFNQKIVDKCSELLQTVTNDHADDEKWKQGRLALTKEWKENTQNLVRPRFKRDHKRQKRMQCAINYNDFYSYFLPRYRKEIVV